ncbi:MAG: dihydrofolate reductase [Chitinophagaceae bacterium]|nr:dihydrofolate reductase [Chitinophagaceae bacterium]
MNINLVVAATENNVIGKDNKLLWHLPNDLKFFKNTTWAMPVIMGRKTYESMGKPLKGRTNIVITSNHAYAPGNGVIVVDSIDGAVEESAKTDAKECYIIGGGEIFKQAMPRAHRIYMTRVHTTMDGDTFFPPISEKEWQLTSNTRFESDAKHALPYSFQIWQRK